MFLSAPQNRPANQLKVGEANGIDVLLHSIAGYRNKDPATDEEHEFLENLFDALCCLTMQPANKDRFVLSEGEAVGGSNFCYIPPFSS